MSDASQPAGTPPVPALFFARVERRYPQAEGALDILRGADLAIWPGELVALVAPSGAGKSTLLHLAGLLERPDGGEVYIGGRPTAAMPDVERTRLRREEMGFVYQFHHLLPEFSALENVVMPQLIRGLGRAEAKARATELLSFLGLKDRLPHRPAELSGGEQQRVAIARAVANGPRLLLADEPTGNVDPALGRRLLRLFLELNKLGTSVIIATHDFGIMDAVNARRMVLNAGRLRIEE